MGIKGFVRWLTKRYPLIIRPFNDISRPVINNLYIDFNQLLFQAKQMCLNSSDNVLIMNEALRYLDSIIQFVRPTTLIFIAIDGTPPYNKLYRQLDKTINFWDKPLKLNDGSYPDFPLFFPGTPFIHTFQHELREFIKYKTKNDAAWMNPQVIYSSVYNPGESEHKIFEFIKERSKELKKRQINKPKDKSNEVHCIFSKDADIIPLIMLTPENNFLLMRPELNTNEENSFYLTESSFELIYVNILREYLVKDHIEPELKDSTLDPKLRKHRTNYRLRNIFSDWVFIISLFGNDFFDGFLKFAKLKKSDGLDLLQDMMNLYEEIILNKNLSLIDKDNKEIKLENFGILLKAFLDQIGESVDEKRYNTLIQSECEKLLDNFHWILQYYLGKCPSWSYFYSSNTRDIKISDIYIYIQKQNENKSYKPPSFEDDSTEMTPFEYILAHFPKWQQFLPNAILLKVKKFMSDYEKKTGKTDLYLFSYKDIKRIVQDSIPDISDEDLKRNNSTTKFLIIDSGEIQHLSLENIALKQSFENVWIPSLNKISDFFQKAKAGEELKPTYKYDICDYPLEDLKDYIVNKVILVDYPFLKPFIVKSVKMEKKINLRKIKGIDIGENPILTVIGYNIVISSTDRSSTVICSQIDTYPYCLTAPLVPKLETVLEIMKATPSAIQNNHKVLVTHEDFVGRIGTIIDIDEQNQEATVRLLKIDQPNLEEFLSSPHRLITNTNSTGYSIKSLNQLEKVLDELEYDEKTYKKEHKFSFDDLIWEGKGLEKEQHVEIGDRVVSITHGGPIDFGQFGTIVAYNFTNEEVSVVFDKVCKYGCSLGNQLKSTRGIIGKTYDFYIIKNKS